MMILILICFLFVKSNGDGLTVMSYNTFLIGEDTTWKWWIAQLLSGSEHPWHPSDWDLKRKDAIVDQICESGADVVGIQELWAYRDEILERLYECGYESQIIKQGCFLETMHINCLFFDDGVALVSKVSLENTYATSFKNYADLPRGFVSATITKKDITYQIVSLHQQPWAEANDTTVEVRREQAHEVKKHINLTDVNVDCTIILGDFNFGSSEEIRNIWEDSSYETNVFDDSNRKTWEPFPYFGYTEKYSNSFANLDNIIVLSQRDMVVSSEMALPYSINVDNQTILVSDHKPLITEIQENSESVTEMKENSRYLYKSNEDGDM